MWMLTETGEIRRDDSCLDYHGVGDNIRNTRCHGTRGNQEWRYEEHSKMIHHVSSNKCITITEDKKKIMMSKCLLGNQRQIWMMKLTHNNVTHN